MKRTAIVCISLLVAAASQALELPLHKLKMPPGYRIEIYAEVPNARQMTSGGDGIIYVGSRRLGKVHAVIDRDGDRRAEQVLEIDTDLTLPSGVAYRNGDLYVAAVSQILRYANIDEKLQAVPEPEVVLDTLPTETYHGWKFIEFGPDGLLYVPVGAPCNVCLSDNPQFASILRLNVDDPNPEVYAEGVRNTVGFDWHPDTGELWFTDNGRDNLGDEFPSCELNRISKPKQHFGFPFFHAAGEPDPEFGSKGMAASHYVEPELLLGPHVAPLGMLFYTGKMLPQETHKQILIAEHGSWNRSAEAGHTGHRVVLATFADGEAKDEVLIEGWLGEDNEAWGRPNDLLQLADGSVLIADDKAGVIYRLSYTAL